MSVDPARLDELTRAVRAAGGRGVGRRSLLRGASLSALALGVPGLLAACGTDSQVQTSDSCTSEDLSGTEKALVFSNWPEYIDRKGKKIPTLAEFETTSGISVTYNTDINDNTEFFGKVKDQLGGCEPVGRDIITMTDWMAARMVGLGWVQELDKSAMPNVEANLKPDLRSPTWDPERDYSVPWQSGLTGIAYNAKYTDEVGSFEELMTRGDLKGKISLLSEMGDTMLFMLLLEGANPEEFTSEEWSGALGRLEGYVGSGQVRRFTGNDYIRDLNAGNVVACEAWSGDVIAMQYDNPDIKWVVPEEGLSLWSDNMLVPNRADHKANAEAMMDFYYQPEIAAKLAAWVNYICPVEGAQQAMEKVDPSLVDNPLIFPGDDFLAGAYGFMELDESTRQQYDKDFARVIGA
ncbi:Spermidine/putrescine-binding periplasmic protein precursor [Nocardioides dokdonensis FR1436]|uniref:Spermidine/putrescine-binding periplasmic protein n=1 Tax=Nocardioides dokdonensis FR1436 TaxID=1300347 RepID=A0A1A9GNH1_9ACTN|nr:spermidine/putrescine ABC transporter substrate-binding protein [Nocardioides dokdonensis]ANH38995.1 Spermidine/putrescine-binding periplasmic protein precursor [Nocardioides dokdonensis FR1436]